MLKTFCFYPWRIWYPMGLLLRQKKKKKAINEIVALWCGTEGVVCYFCSHKDTLQ